MRVSDSADPLFIKEFLSRKQLFNTRALDHYVKRKALKNCGIDHADHYIIYTGWLYQSSVVK